MHPLRAVILAKPRRPLDEVEAWGEKLYVRRMPSAEKDLWERDTTLPHPTDPEKRVTNYENFRAKLVVRTLVDAEGNRIFTDADAPLLGEKDFPDVEAVFDVALKANNLTRDAVADALKNSGGGPTAASSSASRDISDEPSKNSKEASPTPS